MLEYTVLALDKQACEPRPDDPVIGVLMLLVDETGQAHQADLLAAEAMRDWIGFLRDRLHMDVQEWETIWGKKALPAGVSAYKSPLPEELAKLIKQQADQRSRSF